MNIWKKTYLFLCGIMSLSTVCAQQISSQSEFDQLVDRINSGKPVKASLSPGEYILKVPIVAHENLVLEGRDALVTGPYDLYEVSDTLFSTRDYYVYAKKREIASFGLFVDEQHLPVPLSEHVDAETGVNSIQKQVIGEKPQKSGINLSIPLAAGLRRFANKKFAQAFGFLDCGWSRVNFKIQNANDNLFNCVTLNSTNVQDLSYDLKTYRKSIRYVVYNVEPDGQGIFYDDKNLYVPRKYSKIRYLADQNSQKSLPQIETFSSLNLKGVTFENVGMLNIKSKAQDECILSQCTFRNTLSNTLQLTKQNKGVINEAFIQDCSFMYCSILSGTMISLESPKAKSNCIVFRNNKVSRYPKGNVMYKNTSSSIHVDGDVSLVNNEVYNSCRDHMYLSHGLILCKENVIYNDDNFYAKKQRSMSSDFGLIYCGNIFYNYPDKVLSNTLNFTTIEGNLIYGAMAYGGNARGIFIDDGRGDVTCIHNAVFNTQYYSIDARVEKNFKGLSSVRNKFIENVVDNRYRLQVSAQVDDENLSISQSNYLICSERDNVLSHVKNIRNDVRMDLGKYYFSNEKSKMVLKKSDYLKLSSMPFWDSVEHLFLK